MIQIPLCSKKFRRLCTGSDVAPDNDQTGVTHQCIDFGHCGVEVANGIAIGIVEGIIGSGRIATFADVQISQKHKG